MTEEAVDWLVIPDAKPRRMIPERAPTELGGFRFPRLFDGVDPDGAPVVSPQRGRITDEATRQRILDYLSRGRVVLDTGASGHDAIDATRAFTYRFVYRTDGTWIWMAATDYYLRWHHIAPEPAFLQHIVDNNYAAPPVDDDTARAANTATDQWLTIVRKLDEDWLADHGHPRRVGDETRFSPKMNQYLLEMGWYKGRDIRDKVTTWLEKANPIRLAADAEDLYWYANLPVAIDIMAEFGGLRSAGGTKFRIYPKTGEEDLDFAAKFHFLGEECEVRMSQIGDIEFGRGGLGVDENGEIYIVGPVNFYVARNIDEALIRMSETTQFDRI